MHLGTERFPEHAVHALQDVPLQQALQLLVSNFVPRRVVAMAALGDAEDLCTQARAIKEQTIARLAPFSAWTQSRDFKAIAPWTLREHWSQSLQWQRALCPLPLATP